MFESQRQSPESAGQESNLNGHSLNTSVDRPDRRAENQAAITAIFEVLQFMTLETQGSNFPFCIGRDGTAGRTTFIDSDGNPITTFNGAIRAISRSYYALTMSVESLISECPENFTAAELHAQSSQSFWASGRMEAASGHASLPPSIFNALTELYFINSGVNRILKCFKTIRPQTDILRKNLGDNFDGIASEFKDTFVGLINLGMATLSCYQSRIIAAKISLARDIAELRLYQRIRKEIGEENANKRVPIPMSAAKGATMCEPELLAKLAQCAKEWRLERYALTFPDAVARIGQEYSVGDATLILTEERKKIEASTNATAERLLIPRRR